jgi:Fe-S cluster biogenesis protein NfuA
MLTDEMISAQIKEVLDELRPQFLMHGGNIKLVNYEKGVVRVQLFGACNGCPSSNYTLKLLVENTLKKEVPQVILVEEVFD